MSNIDIIRAWKDEEYRNSLSEYELAKLPEHPAGLIEELTDVQMEAIGGGSYGAHCSAACSSNCTKPVPTACCANQLVSLVQCRETLTNHLTAIINPNFAGINLRLF